MGAPEFVPQKANRTLRSYSSPPRRRGSWLADRPGDLNTRQPIGDMLGSPGPDQGYALTIAESFRDQLELGVGEHAVDALAGSVAVALKRASLFGRAPIMDDVRIGLTLWKFLDASAPAEFVARRAEMFEECSNPHFYDRLRLIADSVPAELLYQPTDAAMAAASTWSPA